MTRCHSRSCREKVPEDPAEWRKPDEDWIPPDYEKDEWYFRVKKEAREIWFDSLVYAKDALESYAEFKRLRDEGTIDTEAPFQVCLLPHESALLWFFSTSVLVRL